MNIEQKNQLIELFEHYAHYLQYNWLESPIEIVGSVPYKIKQAIADLAKNDTIISTKSLSENEFSNSVDFKLDKTYQDLMDEMEQVYHLSNKPNYPKESSDRITLLRIHDCAIRALILFIDKLKNSELMDGYNTPSDLTDKKKNIDRTPTARFKSKPIVLTLAEKIEQLKNSPQEELLSNLFLLMDIKNTRQINELLSNIEEYYEDIEKKEEKKEETNEDEEKQKDNEKNKAATKNEEKDQKAKRASFNILSPDGKLRNLEQRLDALEKKKKQRFPGQRKDEKVDEIELNEESHEKTNTGHINSTKEKEATKYSSKYKHNAESDTDSYSENENDTESESDSPSEDEIYDTKIDSKTEASYLLINPQGHSNKHSSYGSISSHEKQAPRRQISSSTTQKHSFIAADNTEAKEMASKQRNERRKNTLKKKDWGTIATIGTSVAIAATIIGVTTAIIGWSVILPTLDTIIASIGFPPIFVVLGVGILGVLAVAGVIIATPIISWGIAKLYNRISRLRPKHKEQQKQRKDLARKFVSKHALVNAENPNDINSAKRMFESVRDHNPHTHRPNEQDKITEAHLGPEDIIAGLIQPSTGYTLALAPKDPMVKGHQVLHAPTSKQQAQALQFTQELFNDKIKQGGTEVLLTLRRFAKLQLSTYSNIPKEIGLLAETLCIDNINNTLVAKSKAIGHLATELTDALREQDTTIDGDFNTKQINSSIDKKREILVHTLKALIHGPYPETGSAEDHFISLLPKAIQSKINKTYASEFCRENYPIQYLFHLCYLLFEIEPKNSSRLYTLLDAISLENSDDLQACIASILPTTTSTESKSNIFARMSKQLKKLQGNKNEEERPLLEPEDDDEKDVIDVVAANTIAPISAAQKSLENRDARDKTFILDTIAAAIQESQHIKDDPTRERYLKIVFYDPDNTSFITSALTVNSLNPDPDDLDNICYTIPKSIDSQIDEKDVTYHEIMHRGVELWELIPEDDETGIGKYRPTSILKTVKRTITRIWKKQLPKNIKSRIIVDAYKQSPEEIVNIFTLILQNVCEANTSDNPHEATKNEAIEFIKKFLDQYPEIALGIIEAYNKIVAANWTDDGNNIPGYHILYQALKEGDKELPAEKFAKFAHILHQLPPLRLFYSAQTVNESSKIIEWFTKDQCILHGEKLEDRLHHCFVLAYETKVYGDYERSKDLRQGISTVFSKIGRKVNDSKITEETPEKKLEHALHNGLKAMVTSDELSAYITDIINAYIKAKQTVGVLKQEQTKNEITSIYNWLMRQNFSPEKRARFEKELDPFRRQWIKSQIISTSTTKSDDSGKTNTIITHTNEIDIVLLQYSGDQTQLIQLEDDLRTIFEEQYDENPELARITCARCLQHVSDCPNLKKILKQLSEEQVLHKIITAFFSGKTPVANKNELAKMAHLVRVMHGRFIFTQDSAHYSDEQISDSGQLNPNKTSNAMEKTKQTAFTRSETLGHMLTFTNKAYSEINLEKTDYSVHYHTLYKLAIKDFNSSEAKKAFKIFVTQHLEQMLGTSLAIEIPVTDITSKLETWLITLLDNPDANRDEIDFVIHMIIQEGDDCAIPANPYPKLLALYTRIKNENSENDHHIKLLPHLVSFVLKQSNKATTLSNVILPCLRIIQADSEMTADNKISLLSQFPWQDYLAQTTELSENFNTVLAGMRDKDPNGQLLFMAITIHLISSDCSEHLLGEFLSPIIDAYFQYIVITAKDDEIQKIHNQLMIKIILNLNNHLNSNKQKNELLSRFKDAVIKTKTLAVNVKIICIGLCNYISIQRPSQTDENGERLDETERQAAIENTAVDFLLALYTEISTKLGKDIRNIIPALVSFFSEELPISNLLDTYILWMTALLKQNNDKWDLSAAPMMLAALTEAVLRHKVKDIPETRAENREAIPANTKKTAVDCMHELYINLREQTKEKMQPSLERLTELMLDIVIKVGLVETGDSAGGGDRSIAEETAYSFIISCITKYYKFIHQKNPAHDLNDFLSNLSTEIDASCASAESGIDSKQAFAGAVVNIFFSEEEADNPFKILILTMLADDKLRDKISATLEKYRETKSCDEKTFYTMILAITKDTTTIKIKIDAQHISWLRTECYNHLNIKDKLDIAESFLKTSLNDNNQLNIASALLSIPDEHRAEVFQKIFGDKKINDTTARKWFILSMNVLSSLPGDPNLIGSEIVNCYLARFYDSSDDKQQLDEIKAVMQQNYGLWKYKDDSESVIYNDAKIPMLTDYRAHRYLYFACKNASNINKTNIPFYVLAHYNMMQISNLGNENISEIIKQWTEETNECKPHNRDAALATYLQTEVFPQLQLENRLALTEKFFISLHELRDNIQDTNSSDFRLLNSVIQKVIHGFAFCEYPRHEIFNDSPAPQDFFTNIQYQFIVLYKQLCNDRANAEQRNYRRTMLTIIMKEVATLGDLVETDFITEETNKEHITQTINMALFMQALLYKSYKILISANNNQRQTSDLIEEWEFDDFWITYVTANITMEEIGESSISQRTKEIVNKLRNQGQKPNDDEIDFMTEYTGSKINTSIDTHLKLIAKDQENPPSEGFLTCYLSRILKKPTTPNDIAEKMPKSSDVLFRAINNAFADKIISSKLDEVTEPLNLYIALLSYIAPDMIKQQHTQLTEILNDKAEASAKKSHERKVYDKFQEASNKNNILNGGVTMPNSTYDANIGGLIFFGKADDESVRTTAFEDASEISDSKFSIE